MRGRGMGEVWVMHTPEMETYQKIYFENLFEQMLFSLICKRLALLAFVHFTLYINYIKHLHYTIQLTISQANSVGSVVLSQPEGHGFESHSGPAVFTQCSPLQFIHSNMTMWLSMW